MKMMSWFFKIGEASLPLIFGVIAALIWANMDYDGYSSFIHFKVIGNWDVHFLANDIFMTFFFGIAGVEIVRSLTPGGNLYPMNKAVSTLFATAGGVIGPIVVFFILNHFMGSPAYSRGWAIPTATDIAMALLFAKLVFGPRHPAVSFLILLAVIDDGIGLAIIAIFYPDPVNPVVPAWLGLVAAAMLVAYIFNVKLHIKSYWPYLLVPGVVSWIGLYFGNLHPSLALVFIIPFLPRISKNKSVRPALARLEHEFKIPVDYGLFLFGIANAGVQMSSMSELTIIIFLSLFVGKTLGVFLMTNFAGIIGFPKPDGIKNFEVILIGMIAGIGLTVALFVANQAYVDVSLQGAAKMGALFSIFIGFIVALISAIFIEKRFLFKWCRKK